MLKLKLQYSGRLMRRADSSVSGSLLDVGVGAVVTGQVSPWFLPQSKVCPLSPLLLFLIGEIFYFSGT